MEIQFLQGVELMKKRYSIMSKIADEIVKEYKMKEYYKKLKENKEKGEKENVSKSNRQIQKIKYKR